MATNLLSTTSLIQAPFIKVKIGNYTFGVYDKNNPSPINRYPNYIQDLTVEKVNGQVNKYTLTINYQITEYNDPNYFEKVFSSVSESRVIWFTYGDATQSNYVYRDEKAMITKVQCSIGTDSNSLSYKVSAVSTLLLANTGGFTFVAPSEPVQPSELILQILENNAVYHLLDLFTGMTNLTKVKENLIPRNDQKVILQTKTNYSVLEYLQYLVDNMTPNTSSELIKESFYILKFVDDVTDEFGGTYFKIESVDRKLSHPEAYEINIGYPSANLVTNVSVNTDNSYSLYYNYQNEIHPDSYVERINSYGEDVRIYSPVIASNTTNFNTNENDKTWWTKMSQFPVTLGFTIKGLLRPAMLMSYVRVNFYFFGKKHIYSGLYVITSQQDHVGTNGYQTTLNLTRLGGDESYLVV